MRLMHLRWLFIRSTSFTAITGDVRASVFAAPRQLKWYPTRRATRSPGTMRIEAHRDAHCGVGPNPNVKWLHCTPNHAFELLLEEFLEANGDRLKRQPLQHAANKCMDYQAARFCISHPA